MAKKRYDHMMISLYHEYMFFFKCLDDEPEHIEALCVDLSGNEDGTHDVYKGKFKLSEVTDPDWTDGNYVSNYGYLPRHMVWTDYLDLLMEFEYFHFDKYCRVDWQPIGTIRKVEELRDWVSNLSWFNIYA